MTVCFKLLGKLWRLEPEQDSLPVIAVYGVFAGIFIGCFLVSLAETVKSIPIFVRRARLTTGLCIVIIFFALGKGIGSLFYFMHDMMG